MEVQDLPSYATLSLATVVATLVIFSAVQLVRKAEGNGSLSDARGRRYRVLPIPGDGNCGFQAVAVGLNELEKEKIAEDGVAVDLDEISESDIRKLITKEAESAPSYYKEKLKDFGFEAEDLENFVNAVTESGIDGHWLGARFGEVELMMIARAIGMRINVFVNAENEVRCYQTHDFGEKSLGLLYSGSAERGHFDLLVEV